MRETPPVSTKSETLRALHHGPDMLVMPNAWDAGTALAVQQAGFPAVATTSAGVARARGYEDGEHMPVDLAFAAVAEITRPLSIPVTADMESGYGLEPALFAARLRGTGAVGCNYEDTDHATGGQGLLDADEQAQRIATLRGADADVVINARVDTFARHHPDAYAEGVRRARLYLDAGADCVYPITLSDEAMIGEFVQAVSAPVNIYWHSQAPSLDRLRALGVRRLTVGSGLHRKTMQAFAAQLEGLLG
jgi:2-methylisocitrate lyase-like PEP mutase family enzyme